MSNDTPHPKTAGQIRRENLERLVEQFGTLDAVAEATKTSPVYLSQIRNALRESKSGNPREMGSQLARRLEAAAGKPAGWMDTDHGSDGLPARGRRTAMDARAASVQHRPEGGRVSDHGTGDKLPTIQAAVMALGESLSGLSERTRRNIHSMLGDLVTDPACAGELASEIAAIVSAAKRSA